MNETWRTVPGFENHIEVSSLGRLRTVDREITLTRRGVEQTRRLTGRVVPLFPSSKGYLRASIRIDGRNRNIPVHRAVLLAFRGPCPAGMQACHGDDDKSRNTLANLRWDTPEANILDRRANGGYNFKSRSAA
jgi:hypothetical protein